MSSFGVLSRRVKSQCVTCRAPGKACRPWARSIATQENVKKDVNEKLPLAGIRVLDMTRVLAGVGDFYIWMRVEHELTTAALLHADTRRSWVCITSMILCYNTDVIVAQKSLKLNILQEAMTQDHGVHQI